MFYRAVVSFGLRNTDLEYTTNGKRLSIIVTFIKNFVNCKLYTNLEKIRNPTETFMSSKSECFRGIGVKVANQNREYIID